MKIYRMTTKIKALVIFTSIIFIRMQNLAIPVQDHNQVTRIVAFCKKKMWIKLSLIFFHTLKVNLINKLITARHHHLTTEFCRSELGSTCVLTVQAKQNVNDIPNMTSSFQVFLTSGFEQFLNYVSHTCFTIYSLDDDEYWFMWAVWQQA